MAYSAYPLGWTDPLRIGFKKIREYLSNIDDRLTSAGVSQWAANGNDIYNTNSGNVGIGTDTPGSTLEIANSGNVTLGMHNTLNTDWVITAGLRWRLSANGTEFLRIDENGNMGIKTDSPEGDLDVYADTTAATIQVHGDAVPAQLRIKSDDENRRIVALDESNTVMNQIAFEDDSIEIYGATTAVQLGTFLTSGYVGFGTNNPTRRLEVASTEQIVAHVRSTSTAAAYLTLAEADTSNQSQVGIGALGNALALRAAGGNHMTLVGEGDFQATAYGNIIPTIARCDVTADALGSGNNTIVLDSFASGLGINTNGDYALASNEIEVPTDGVYRITIALSIAVTGGTVTLMTAQLNINGSTSSGGVQYAGAVEYQAGASLGYFPAHMTDLLELSAGDDISVTVNITGSGGPAAEANGSVFVERILGTQ